jgi:Transposase and inactivated derivatives
MKDEMTAQLVTDVLIMAIWGRGKPLLHHSDQGSQGGFKRLSQHQVCSLTTATRQALPPAFSSPRVFRPDGGFLEDLNIAAAMPPACRNNLVPTGCDIPAVSAASSLAIPCAIPNQNRWSSDRPATGGRPGDGNGARPERCDRRCRMPIATSFVQALRQPLESAQYTSEQFQRLMADHGITCSISRSGNVWDNAAMESFFSSLKTERTARKVYRTRGDARADVFDYIERFYN